MKQLLRVILVSLAIFAIYLPAAYFMGRDFVPPPRPEGLFVQQLLRMQPTQGFAYETPDSTGSGLSDQDEENQKSPIVIYENTNPLGPRHSSRDHVEAIGLGRYSHTKRPLDSWAYFSFSTSDNSDPRTNGRTYWAVIPKGTVAVRR